MIRAETLVKHEAATGRTARWMTGVKPMRFRGFDNSAQESMGAVELDRLIKGYRVMRMARAATGAAGF